MDTELKIQEQALNLLDRTSRKGPENAQALTEFLHDLTNIINRYNQESHSNTPDHLLADYLIECLLNFEKIVNKRDIWWGHFPE